MNLAFYYHITVGVRNNSFFLPGFLGLFVDELAKNVDKLYLIGHTCDEIKDYELGSANIELINLGTKTNSLSRAVFPKNYLKRIFPYLDDIDCFLVRSPSPLAPAFSMFRNRNIPVFYYVVGDYSVGADLMRQRTIRDWAIRRFLKWNHHKFILKIKNHKTIVNSPALANQLSGIASETVLIPSTTITESDFLKSKRKDLSIPTQLLYTGRLDLQKGLLELVEVFGRLITDGYNLHLNFVGWEENISRPVEKKLRQRANVLGVASNVVFQGKKSVGKELNAMYQMSDIYCIPSYHEGFPRSIWEAMANRLPVIATNVGGIPYFLENGNDAILIDAKNNDQLYNAISLLVKDDVLRNRLIENGYAKATQNTVGRRAKELINYVIENI